MDKEKQNIDLTDAIIDDLTGCISDECRSELNQWLEDSEANRVYYDELKTVWHSTDSISDEKFNVENAFSIFRQRVEKSRQKRRLARRILAYAALVPFILVSCYSIYSNFISSNSNLYENTQISKFTVPNGSKTQVQLCDGSILMLNSGSTVEISPNFGINERRVKLYGEALFDIKSDANIPFIVETQSMDIKVHGTYFNVETFSEDDKIKVALIEGSVELIDKNKSVFLKPNELAIYNILSSEISVVENGIATSCAWLDNHLIFSDELFENIAYALERNFDIKVNIKNQHLKTKHFTGDFVKHETLEQIFNVMFSNGKFSYKITGKTVDIY